MSEVKENRLIQTYAFVTTLLMAFCPQYVELNKSQDNDWFRLESNKEGTRWFGKCWYVQDMLKYQFDVEFDVSTS